MSAIPKYNTSDFYPCRKLSNVLRSSILYYFREYNIKTITVNVSTSMGSGYKPLYKPITLDMLYELKEKSSNRKILNIDRAISILKGNGDTKDYTKTPLREWDRRCGFVTNTFNVMNLQQKKKFRLISMLGRGDLYKGWISYKKQIDKMKDDILDYGQNFECEIHYAKAIYKLYGGNTYHSTYYIIRSIEADTITSKYTLKSYNVLRRLIKAIRKHRRANNEGD